MMSRLILPILIVFCFATSTGSKIFAQERSEPLFIIRVDGKSGFIDRQGNIVIKPLFEDVQRFDDGKAPAQFNKKWGFVDRTGKFIIPPTFDEIRWSFSEGVTPVLIGNKWGYIDESGKVVIKPTLEYGHSFDEGRAIINIGKNETLTHGIIDLKGEMVTQQKFKWSGWSFNEGLLNVQIGEKWGFIDVNGKVIITAIYKEASAFSEGLAAVRLANKRDSCGFIDKTGEFVIPPKFDECWYFKDGLAAIRKDWKYGFINVKGDIVIEPLYDWTYSFSEGLAAVRKDGKWGFIDRKGVLIVPFQYDQVWPFVDGLAGVSFGKWEGGLGYHIMPTYNGKWGYIDKSGKTVWQPTK